MGWQIVKKPPDKWAVWNTITDSFLCWDCSQEQLVDWWAENTGLRARLTAEEWIRDIESGKDDRLTWDECLGHYTDVHGRPFDPDSGVER